MTVYKASAPSNIAIIKYMGKVEASHNRPCNSSLSWTLDHLRTFVELRLLSASARAATSISDIWEPLAESWVSKEWTLSASAQLRFLAHLDRLKKFFNVKQSFSVASANNFPSDCGLASSASSFAALTLAFREFAIAQGLRNSNGDFAKDLSLSQWADLSRQGSGSSCRSFFAPWSLWTNEGVAAVDLKWDPLLHSVIVVDARRKDVSSSEAHRRVSTSLLFEGRVGRAEKRLEQILELGRKNSESKSGDWKSLCELSWQEFWDMHALFETSREPFGYFTGDTIHVLNAIRDLTREFGVGPLITMDAGANVHTLWRYEDAPLLEETKRRLAHFRWISSSDRNESRGNVNP